MLFHEAGQFCLAIAANTDTYEKHVVAAYLRVKHPFEFWYKLFEQPAELAVYLWGGTEELLEVL